MLRSPVHIAAYSGDLNQLEQLLESSESEFTITPLPPAPHPPPPALPYTADVDAVEENERTALMYGAMADRPECVELLLQKGALITAQDSNGQTALHWAALTVCPLCHLSLADQHSSPSSPLQGSHRSLKLLLSQTPGVNIADKDGR